MNQYRRDRIRELLRIADSLPVTLRDAAMRMKTCGHTSRDMELISEFVLRVLDEVGETDEVIPLKSVQESL